MRVIIVDDEKPIRQWFLFVLGRMEGVEVVGAYANGEQALEACRTLEPDVIFTDIMMPVMNGLELIKQVKEKYPHIEMLILSNFDDFEYVSKGLKYGARDYLLKAQADDNDIISFLNRIENIRNKEKEQARERLRTLVMEQLAQLRKDPSFYEITREECEGISEKIEQVLSGNDEVSSGNEWVVEGILQYVMQNYGKPITLSTLAEKFNYNADYLSQLFKTHTGENFKSYLIRVRMEQAKKMLLDGAMRIKDIASELGYSNEMYFSTAFKNYTGMSPQQYARRYRATDFYK